MALLGKAIGLLGAASIPTLWGTWKEITSTGSGITNRFITGTKANTQQQIEEKKLYESIQARLNSLGPIGSGIKATGDLVLKTAAGLHDKVISPYITRPMSTVALLTDINSPLYQTGQYEEGFQFSDIKDAYARSKNVSTAQALTKSTLIPFVGPISQVILSTGKINVNDINLWDDESIQKNFHENDVGRWFTGLGDFALGNFGVGAAAKAAVSVGKVGGAQVGLYTKNKSVEQLDIDMQTVGTVANSHMQTLADSKDIGVISDIVEKYSTNERLVSILYEAKTLDAAKDIILADKGNFAAAERLAGYAPSDLFEVAGVQQQLANKVIQSGNIYLPEGAAVPRIKSAFEHAITKDAQFVKIRNAFFDDSYNPIIGGRAYRPVEPIVGAGVVIATEKAIRSVKSAARFREFDKMGDILETVVGGKVATRLVKFSSRQGELKPLGFVTFSGTRPFAGRVELNAFLNNIKLFDDGSKSITVAPGVKRKVGDIRKEWEIKFVQSGGGVNQLKVLEEIDEQIGRYLAYQKGWFEDAEIKNYLSNYRTAITEKINSFQKTGYAIDHTGRRIESNPQTLSQLIDSYRFTPWNEIERAINLGEDTSALRVGVKKTGYIARKVFEDLNRFWTFDVLARPMFIIKQSIAEPLIAASLAQGSSIIRNNIVSMTRRLVANPSDIIAGKASRTYNKAQLKALQEDLKVQQINFSEASAIKDNLQVEVEYLLSGKASPAVVRSHLANARKSLTKADELLDDIELDLRNSVKPFGKEEAMPNLTMLTRRLAYIKKNPANASASNKAKIIAAEKAIAQYKLTINNMATNKKVIQEADAKLEKAYKDIENIVKEQGALSLRKADVFGKSNKYKRRYYGQEQHNIVLDNNQVITIDSFIAENSKLSAAMRAEVGNTKTTERNFLGELSVGTRKDILVRKVPGQTVRFGDPLYFEELTYLANRHFKEDALFKLILENKSLDELKIWAGSNEGINYLKNFGIEDAKSAVPYLRDKIGLADRMFPSLEARALILQKNVTSQELEKLLAPYSDELFDIHPTDYDYGSVDTGLGHNGFNQATAKIQSAVFRNLMKAENPIREMYFNEIAVKEVARRAQILIDQGVQMTPARFNALRQSAAREAIQDTEKTFYTINNQRRIVFNARLLVAFPNATLNAFYRYSRLAKNNPVATTGFLFNYGRLFQEFGVDENGNPTEDINQITHIVVPGSKDAKFGAQGQGILLNAKSIGFLLNYPGASFVTGISVGKLMEKFPGAEERLKETINLVNPDAYDIMFPYGAPTSVPKAFIAPWMNAAWNAATGPQGKADYLASWKSVYNYHLSLVEMGVEKTLPTEAEIDKEVRTLWAMKAIAGFASPFGVPIKVETSPMRLTETLYQRYYDRYIAQGSSQEQARNLAGQHMLSTLGSKFMVDRVSFRASNKNLNIPATQEAYNRVFKENNELVKSLAGIDKDNISLVSLLTADLGNNPEERSDVILKILSNPDLKLPGTSYAINDLRLTPQEAEKERLKSRTWEKYMQVKDAITAKITDGKSLRSHPELKAGLDYIVTNILAKESPEWYNDFMIAEFGDTSYKYAKALNTIITNSEYMSKNGTTPFWNDVQVFMKIRNMFVMAYQSLPDYDPRKSKLLDAYNAVNEAYAPQWHPKLQTIVKNYFGSDKLKVVS